MMSLTLHGVEKGLDTCILINYNHLCHKQLPIQVNQRRIVFEALRQNQQVGSYLIKNNSTIWYGWLFYQLKM